MACGECPAWAQGLYASGKISKTELSSGNNYAFRIKLEANGTDQLATCQSSFAFLNTDDTNYQAKVAALLSADARYKTVTIAFTKDTSSWRRLTDLSFPGGP